MASLVTHEALRGFTAELFQKAGVSSDNARIIADNLVDSNLYGVDSHGVIRTGIYLKKIGAGAMNPTPEIKYLSERGAFKVIDADNAPGSIAGHYALIEAMALAKSFSVGICGVVQSNHFGAAGLYTRAAAEAGMIGIAMSNVTPLMSLPGLPGRLVGNNPISISIPRPDDFPIVFDIALSNVALGKILVAQKTGDPIPDNWGLDKDGNETTDPTEALNGSLLPIAGHKGFGLAIIVDILCGVLTGGGFLDNLNGLYSSSGKPGNISHLFMAIDPGDVNSMSGFGGRIVQFCSMLMDKDPKDRPGTLMLPGEPEFRKFTERSTKGIPLPDQLVNELAALGREAGIAWIG